jgi:hypothetical protein
MLREISAIFAREEKALTASSRVALSAQPGASQHYYNNVLSPNNESELRLWVLYVAAMVQRATIASERPQNFAIEFLKQARAMRYTSWRQLRDEVLRLFLYDDELDPAGDLLCKEVIGTPLRQLHFFES